MQIRRLFYISTLLLAIGLASTAHAATVRGTDNFTLPADQTTQGNLYVGGRTATVAGHVTGELIVAGGTVDLTGTVDQAVIVLGGTVNIDGPVGGNLHVLGGQVTVNSSVADDLLAGAGSVSIPEGGTVGGDVIAGTGKFTLSGKVNGDIHVAGGSVTINGTVGGSLLARSDNITLNESAEIGKNFKYHSHKQASVSPAAKIGGVTDYTHTSSSNYGSFSVLGLLFRLILLYVATLVLIALFRRHTEIISQTYDRRFFQSLLVGFGFVILAPILGILLFLSIVGVYLAIVLLLVYILVILLSIAYSAISLGHLVVRRFGDGPMSPYLSALIGVALIVLLTTIPIVGGVVAFVLVLAGAGSIILFVFGRGESRPFSTQPSQPALSETPAKPTKPRRRSKTKKEK